MESGDECIIWTLGNHSNGNIIPDVWKLKLLVSDQKLSLASWIFQEKPRLMSLCSTLGPLALAAACASGGTPTSPLHFVCVPAKLGRALTLFLLSICWDCPLSSVCQCCPQAWQSTLVHPRSSPGLPEGSSLSWTPRLTACYLSWTGRRACLASRLLCPNIRSSHEGAAWPLPYTVGSSRLCPLPGPRATSLEPSAAGPLSAAAILPSHEGPAGWGCASPSWWAQRRQWQWGWL